MLLEFGDIDRVATADFTMLGHPKTFEHNKESAQPLHNHSILGKRPWSRARRLTKSHERSNLLLNLEWLCSGYTLLLSCSTVLERPRIVKSAVMRNAISFTTVQTTAPESKT